MTDTNADPPADDQQQDPSPPKNRKRRPTWTFLLGLIFIGASAAALVAGIGADSGQGKLALVGASIVLTAFGFAFGFEEVLRSLLSTSAVDRERDQLESAIETKTRTAKADAVAWRRLSEAEVDDQIAVGVISGHVTVSTGREEGPKPSSYVQLTVPSQALRQANENEVRFSTLLLRYYAHGLVQARRSSMASLWSSVLGIIVIIIGVGIAIFRTDTGIAASITVSLAGVVTNAVGVLFHQQANRALAHMETQTTSLRMDMRADQDGYDAVDLLGNVSDPLIRDRLLAAVVLQLTKATLPPAEEAARGGDDNTQPVSAAAAG